MQTLSLLSRQRKNNLTARLLRIICCHDCTVFIWVEVCLARVLGAVSTPGWPPSSLRQPSRPDDSLSLMLDLIYRLTCENRSHFASTWTPHVRGNVFSTQSSILYQIKALWASPALVGYQVIKSFHGNLSHHAQGRPSSLCRIYMYNEKDQRPVWPLN